ncbi:MULTISPECIES: hypothetical protein [Brevibacterium]|nr:hypothetical protein [Brevibacterium sp.]
MSRRRDWSVPASPEIWLGALAAAAARGLLTRHFLKEPDSMNPETNDETVPGATRRKVVVGAAWSLPVIAAATAVPAASASAPVCEEVTHCYSPKDHGKKSPLGPKHNVAAITVITGKAVIVRYLRKYPHQTSINIDHTLVHRSGDHGVREGFEFTYDLTDAGICDPEFIQVDGNNVHYYGGGVFR